MEGHDGQDDSRKMPSTTKECDNPSNLPEPQQSRDAVANPIVEPHLEHRASQNASPPPSSRTCTIDAGFIGRNLESDTLHDHPQNGTADTAKPGLHPSSDATGAGATRKHHLLRHTLPTDITAEAALAGFGAATVEQALERLSTMSQRELQTAFEAIYGVRALSNNNQWLRKKLTDAFQPLTSTTTAITHPIPGAPTVALSMQTTKRPSEQQQSPPGIVRKRRKPAPPLPADAGERLPLPPASAAPPAPVARACSEKQPPVAELPRRQRRMASAGVAAVIAAVQRDPDLEALEKADLERPPPRYRYASHPSNRSSGAIGNGKSKNALVRCNDASNGVSIDRYTGGNGSSFSDESYSEGVLWQNGGERRRQGAANVLQEWWSLQQRQRHEQQQQQLLQQRMQQLHQQLLGDNATSDVASFLRSLQQEQNAAMLTKGAISRLAATQARQHQLFAGDGGGVPPTGRFGGQAPGAYSNTASVGHVPTATHLYQQPQQQQQQQQSQIQQPETSLYVQQGRAPLNGLLPELFKMLQQRPGHHRPQQQQQQKQGQQQQAFNAEVHELKASATAADNVLDSADEAMRGNGLPLGGVQVGPAPLRAQAGGLEAAQTLAESTVQSVVGEVASNCGVGGGALRVAAAPSLAAPKPAAQSDDRGRMVLPGSNYSASNLLLNFLAQARAAQQGVGQPPPQR